MSDPIPQVALKAVRLFQNKKPEEAWESLAPVLDACARSSDAQQLAGQILKSLGRHGEALPYLSASADLAPQRAEYRTNYANTLMAVEQPEDAVGHYKTALQLMPTFRAAKLGYGRACLALGQYQDAIAVAAALIDEVPDDAEAWNLKAQAQLQSDALRDAVSSARRALALAPDYVAAHHTLANCLLEQADTDGARRALNAIGTPAAGLPEVLAAKVRLTLLEGDAVAARDQLEALIGRHADSLELQVLLARLKYLCGDGDFTKFLRERGALQRADSKMRLMEARLLRGAGRLEDALGALLPAIEITNSNPAFLHEASSVYLDAADFEAAGRFANAAWQAAPRVTEMIAQYAQCLLCLGDDAAASPLIKTLLDRRPFDQRFIAFESSCARLAGDKRYRTLCDYEAFVKGFEIQVPNGWSSLSDFLGDLKAELVNLHASLNTPLDQSVRAGTQTPASLLHSSSTVIKALIGAFDEPIRCYQDALGSDSSHPLLARKTDSGHELRGCWSVMLNQAGYHVNHVHPQGWISSAFYVEVPPETKDTQQQSGWLKFGEPRYPIPGATVEHIVAPKEGNLALFPSYFWHGTTPLKNNFTRLSVAFDAVPA